jgi:hypothetical protein
MLFVGMRFYWTIDRWEKIVILVRLCTPGEYERRRKFRVSIQGEGHALRG